MMQHRGTAILFFLLILSVAAMAVTPQFWENFTQKDLLKGNFNHVSLSPDGNLYLAPAHDLVFDTNQPYIFSMVRDKSGNLYVGTGDEGKVFRIDPQGKGSLYFQSEELNVFAMALDDSDVLYVGTSPDGKVYKVSGPEQSTEFCDPESKYIWSMIFDDSGNLYIGTGADGTIYKVDKNGEKSSFYTCSDNHVVCLAKSRNKSFLVGTSPGGLIIEVTSDGNGFTLMDTPLQDVHSLVMDRFGIIYAVASSSKGLSIPASSKPDSKSSATKEALTATVTIESIISLADSSEDIKAVKAPGGEKDSAGAKSAVYAYVRDGSAETIYSSSEQMVFDAVVRDDDSLLLATGPKGRLLSVDSAKQVTVITDSAEEDLTRILSAGNVTYIAGSNQGKIYRLQSKRSDAGTFESDTLDAKTVASWGKISWHITNPKNADIRLSTRTGNTEKADTSWSDWSKPYASPEQQISSPRARYLQWRASFKNRSDTDQNSSTDLLDGIQIAYLQQNLRPQVTSINVLPYGIELQKQPSLASGSLTLVTPEVMSDGRSLNAPRERGRDLQPLAPRQVLQPGAQSFTWKASDDNQDSLEYSLYFKGEGESDWKLLTEKLTDTFYTLNAVSLPDGTYRLKVVASDAPSNPQDKFLIGELISNPFVLTNASPRIEITKDTVTGKKAEVRFQARVLTGRIATAEFSIDGGEWYLVFPDDGIADSLQEDYRIATPELATGEHLIGIRASDGNGNTGTAKLVIRIP
jgi:sugar lactone lactonase YvrE